MEGIEVDWDASVSSGTARFSLEGMNISTLEEWNSLSEEEQKDKLQEALNDSPEQPFMVVDKFSNE